MALIGVQWVLYGYSLAFGADISGIIGGLNFLGFHGVGALPNPDYSKTIPHGLFAAFQMMFAVITPALITGAFVERVKFKSFLLFSLLWATLVYDPLCHWVWGQGGWLKNDGRSGFCRRDGGPHRRRFFGPGLCPGDRPRKGFGKSPMEPNNIPLTVLGAGLLWVGWFGFNAGSALAANGVAVNALLDHQHLRRDGRPGLDDALLAGRPAQHPGDRHGDGGRSGGGDPGFGLCDAPGRHGDRGGRRASLLLHDAFSGPDANWMSPWMSGPVTAWPAPGA